MISVDDHVIEHPTVWTDRLPAKYRDVAPRVITAKDELRAKHAIFGEVVVGPGEQTWMYEDRLYPQLALLSVRAWNDFIIEEWSDPYPGRFIPMSILPLWDIDLCVAEVERMAGR